MQDLVYSFFNNQYILYIASLIGVPLTITLIVMFLMKSNRDERGWKIFGKASVVAFIYFMIMTNVIANVVGSMPFDEYELSKYFWYNIIQCLYDTVLFVEIVAILILKNLE